MVLVAGVGIVLHHSDGALADVAEVRRVHLTAVPVVTVLSSVLDSACLER